MKFKTNYHTHHKLCKHAGGTAEDFIKVAIDLNMEVLGISDHAPSYVLDETFRMSWAEFPIYVEDVLKNKAKYKDQIEVEIGLEVEFLDPNMNYYDELLSKVDYLILGQHFIQKTKETMKSTYNLDSPEDLKIYTKELINGMKSGKFVMIAHPDLFMFSYPKFDEHAKQVAVDLAEASKMYNIPLEFNANGIRRGEIETPEGTRYYYPREDFWRVIKDSKAEIILSADAHSPKELYDFCIKNALKMADRLGITFKKRLL